MTTISVTAQESVLQVSEDVTRVISIAAVGPAGPGGTGGGTFISLSDTPGTYSGQGLKVVRVNAAENAVEFTLLSTVAATGDYDDLINVPLTFNPSAHVHATSDITSGVFDDARISESSVTQHEDALTITESQISDLGSYLTAEVNDLTANVTWADVPDVNITESSVTQHEDALTITESQISDLGNYAVVGHTHTASDITDFSTAADARISASSIGAHADVTITAAASGDFVRHNGTVWVDSPLQLGDISSGMVTQHEGDLTITESQISDLGTYLTAEVNDLTASVTWDTVPDAFISSTSVVQHEGDLTITESQISDLGNYSVVGHTHTASEITDFSSAADARIAAAVLNDLSDVTITSNTTGEILRWNGSAWVNATLAEAGIPTTFLGLTDTPGSMGFMGQLLRVNGAGTALEFFTASTPVAPTFITLPDTPAGYAGNALRAVRVNAAANAVEFFTLASIATSGSAADLITGSMPNARIVVGNITQHQSSLSIATSQLTGTLPDARVAESNVTQHEGALAITESQITDLGNYSVVGHVHAATDITSGTLADARVAESNVTQHESALSIARSQISNPVLNVDGAWVTSTAYALNDYVFNDGVAYLCISAHTSGASTEPGVGGDWEDEWVRLDPDAVDASSGVESEIGYYEGSKRYRHIRSFTVASDTTSGINLGSLPRTPSKLLVLSGSMNVGSQKVQLPYVGYDSGAADPFAYNIAIVAGFIVFLFPFSLSGGTAPTISAGWVIETYLEYI